MPHSTNKPPNSRWLRAAWLFGGSASLLLGIIGIFLPVLPTTPFVLIAAYCFARGSPRWERWLLEHRYFGRYVREWREHHAVPLRAKQLATLMMVASSALSWWSLTPSPWRWAPGAFCIVVGVWLWRLPTLRPQA